MTSADTEEHPGGDPQASASRGYMQLIRENHDYRYLWLGTVASFLGDWFNLVASASLLGGLTDSGVAIGGLFAIRMLAPFLTSPLGGVLADRHDRRRQMIVADLVRATVVLGFLLVRGPGDAWLLFLLTALQLGMDGIYVPAYGALLPELVEEQDLGTANALGSVTWSVMLALGTGLGGLFAGSVGLYPAFLLDSSTFLLSAFLLSRIQADTRAPARPEGDSPSFGGEYLEGLRYLRAHPEVAALALHKPAALLTTYGGMEVLQTAMARRVFVMGEQGALGMGIMFSAVGLGSAVGPLLARALVPDRVPALRWALAASYLLLTAGLAVVATMASFPVVLGGLVVWSSGIGTMWVFSNHLLMLHLPDAVRGRVFALEFALLTLGNACGATLVGLGLDRPALGLSGIAWIMALAVTAPGLAWTTWVFLRPDGTPARDLNGAAPASSPASPPDS